MCREREERGTVMATSSPDEIEVTSTTLAVTPSTTGSVARSKDVFAMM